MTALSACFGPGVALSSLRLFIDPVIETLAVPGQVSVIDQHRKHTWPTNLAISIA